MILASKHVGAILNVLI